MPNQIVDAFTGPNSTNSISTGVHTASPGGAWTVSEGTAGISSNNAYFSAGGGNNRNNLFQDSTKSDCTIQATVGGITGDWRFCWRVTDSQNLFLITASASTGLTMYREQAGSYTSIGTNAANGAVNDVFKVITSGNTHTLYQNGVSRIVATDSFQATATKHGVSSGDTLGSLANTFSVSTVSTGVPGALMLLGVGAS